MEFEWDEGNIDKNLRHNVHDWEIESALMDPEAVLEARRVVRGEQRRVLLGRVMESGRYPHVVFTVRIKEDVTYYRPISAVDMTEAEQRLYRRRR